jgi:hypothetical protein
MRSDTAGPDKSSLVLDLIKKMPTCGLARLGLCVRAFNFFKKINGAEDASSTLVSLKKIDDALSENLRIRVHRVI